MPDLLTKLGFITLKEYLSLYNIQIEIPINVYIKHTILLNNPDLTNRYSLGEVLNFSIRSAIRKNNWNAITAGYSTKSSNNLYCNVPNSTLNLLKTIEWEKILNSIGDELFIHILVECILVQIVNHNKILLAGNIKDCRGITPKVRCLTRSRMLFKDKDCKFGFDSVNFITKVFSDLRDLHQETTLIKTMGHQETALIKTMGHQETTLIKVMNKVQEKFRKTKVNLIFKTYRFHKDVDQQLSKLDIRPVDKKRLVDFLFCISKNVFKDIFSFYNFRILKAKLSLLISRNRYETLSEEELKSHFKIKQFPWGKSKDKTHYEYVQNMTKLFFFYLFEDFFIPLISTYFYSTETGFGMRGVYYYKRHLWYEFANYHILKFLDEKCYKDESEIMTNVQLQNVRCIPKEEGARIIVNLSKALDNSGGLNKTLYPLYSILKGEVRHKLGNSALGYEDMHKMAYPFLNKHEKLYILKLDLKKCYDNIPHKYLERMIDTLYEKNEYFIKRFYTLGMVKSYVRQGKYFKVMDEDTPSDVHYNEVVFTCDYIYKDDSYNYSYKRENMIKSLKRIALENKIYYQNSSYSQFKGIPQGSVFSNILCGLYLNKIDEKYFNRIIKKGRIIRFVDDYLILTPSLTEMKLFLSCINKLESNGIVFNTKKMVSNFDTKTFKLNEKAEDFIWCGMKLVFKEDKIGFKVDLKTKLNKYSESYVSTNPGIAIFNKMKKLFITRTSKILFSRDNKFVHQNVFDFFLLYKIRLRTLFSRAPFVNESFYLSILEYCTQELIKLCKERNIRISEQLILDISKKAFEEKNL